MPNSRDLRNAWNLLEAALLPSLPTLLLPPSAPPTTHDPRLLSDLLQSLRTSTSYNELARTLLDLSPLVPDDTRQRAHTQARAIWSAALPNLPARAHHHLALFYEHRGWSILDEHPTDAANAFTTALSSLCRVLQDPSFFTLLARDCGQPDRSAWLRDEAPTLWLQPHGDALLHALRPDVSPDPDALRPHWVTLTTLPKIARELNLPQPLQNTLQSISSSWTSRIQRRALQNAQTLAADVQSMTSPLEDLTRPFEYLQAFTAFAGPCEELSIWAIETAVAWAWPLYKSETSDRLKPLVESCRSFGSHLETMLRRGTGAFGRQSICADYLLFVADFRDDTEAELLFQRALSVCPNHRNSRVLISYRVLRKADSDLRKLEYPPDALTRMLSPSDPSPETLYTRVQERIEEAEELYPGNSKLDSYKERLRNVRTKLDGLS